MNRGWIILAGAGGLAIGAAAGFFVGRAGNRAPAEPGPAPGPVINEDLRGADAQLEPGYRGATFRVQNLSALVRPGRRVDLVAHGLEEGTKVSRVFLQNVRVLAVEKALLTVAVHPSEAEEVDWAQKTGSVSVLLRMPGDNVKVETRGVDKFDADPERSTPEQLLEKVPPGQRATTIRARLPSAPAQLRGQRVDLVFLAPEDGDKADKRKEQTISDLLVLRARTHP